jgi:hypothetical protein
MKVTIFTTICLLITNSIFAQNLTIKTIESHLITDQGVEFVGKLKDKNDDLYLNDDFDNNGIIYVNSKSYYLNNIDFNITTNTFESRIKRDQLFSYNGDAIDSVSINGLTFKKEGNYFYEILYEDNNNLLLKKYDLKFKPGVVNRIDGSQGKPVVSVTNKYLLKSGKTIHVIELDKKGILSLLESEQEQSEFEKFVDNENLSYRDEEDTIEMIEYIIKKSGKII